MKLKKECLIIFLTYLVSISLGQDGWEIFEEANPSLSKSTDKALKIDDIKKDDSDKDLDLLWEFMDANSTIENPNQNANQQVEVNHMHTEEEDSSEIEYRGHSNINWWSWMKSKAATIFGRRKGHGYGPPQCPFLRNIMDANAHRGNWTTHPFMSWWGKKNFNSNENVRGHWGHAIGNFFRPKNDSDSNTSPFSFFARNFMNGLRNNNSSGLDGNMRNMWQRFNNRNFSSRFHSHHNNHSHENRWLSNHGIRNSTAFLENHSKLICMIVTSTRKLKFFDFIHENFMENIEEQDKLARVEFLNKTVTCCGEEEPSDCLALLRQERIDKFCDEGMPLRPWAFFPINKGLEDDIRTGCCNSNRGDGWHECVKTRKWSFYTTNMS